VPLPDARKCSKKSFLLDHLIGERDQLVWNCYPDSPGGREINNQLELCRPLNRKFGRLLAFEDAAGIYPDLLVHIRKARPIAHEAAGFGKLAHVIDCWNRMSRRQRRDLCATTSKKWIGTDE
jgi:hypothetical protein